MLENPQPYKGKKSTEVLGKVLLPIFKYIFKEQGRRWRNVIIKCNFKSSFL